MRAYSIYAYDCDCFTREYINYRGISVEIFNSYVSRRCNGFVVAPRCAVFSFFWVLQLVLRA
jgi:hypothetical protein